jgi:antitoxin component of MazEF toxin-antitoxin module
MRIIETKGRIADNGSVVLPPDVLETMCVTAGDTVHLAYLSHHPVKEINSYGEFFLTKDGIDHVTEPVEALESAELSVPHVLLEAAGIPLDDDLDIRCEDGAIIISSADPVKQLPPQLMELFDSLDVSHDIIRCVLEGGAEDE